VSWLEIFPALTCGLFSIAVLNINNIRDIESDRKAGKFSIPVRIGKKNAVIYHWLLLTGGLTAALVYVVVTYRSPFQFLFLLALPFFVSNGLAVSRRPPDELDPYLKKMALSTMVFVILFGIGFLLG
jgi:1,4-dihydroxy-2-naphthoate octaprenyltransferase